jgi:hypothetical protein
LRFPRDPQDPWFSELQGDSSGFGRPQFHVTKAVNGTAKEVQPGDTIWLVGQLYSPWGEELPATLDARIDVEAVGPRSGGPGYRYAAAASSRWFPLTNSTASLRALNCVSSTQQVAPLWKHPMHPVGRYLQRIRKLASDEPLREWEVEIESRPLHFISYRIRDGSRAALVCAKRLIGEGVRVFWDRWSLPRRLAERREAVGDRPLDETIETSIKQAALVWGIESPLYGVAGSYAARERELARSLNKYRPVHWD